MARKSRKINAIQKQQINTHIYKVAIYIRLSFENERKKISNSIDTQKNLLLQYLQTQPDMELYNIYEDINCTGTNFNRSGFKKMIEDTQAGFIDCIIIKDLSRLGRNFWETGNFIERIFPLLEVRFISVCDEFDSLTASIDEINLSVPLKNLINEIYAHDISRKIKSSIKIKQKRGEFCGSVAPYGYIKKGKTLIVDKETAKVVVLIFDWILEGYSDYAIAKKLNKQKIMPPSKYRFEKGISKAQKYSETKIWYKSAIKRISENIAYTGALAQGKQQSAFLKGGMFKKDDGWVIVNGTHEGIINKEIFEAVRKIRNSKG